MVKSHFFKDSNLQKKDNMDKKKKKKTYKFGQSL